MVRPFLAFAAVLSLSGLVAGQTTHTVQQQALDFVPDSLLIDCGDTVEWVWTGFGDHDVSEGTDPFGPPPKFFELLTPSNPNPSITFDTKFLFVNDLGPVIDYYCSPHFSFNMVATITVNCPWSNEDSALAGVSGEPLLYGNGPLTDGSLNSLELENAAPNANAVLFVALGPAGAGAPFKGGTLVPVPVLLQVGLSTNASGAISLPFLMPAGLSGVPLVFQWAVSDAAAVKNVSLSNAMTAVGQ